MRLGRDVLGRDLYGVLGVAPTATGHELRQAYRRQVRASHPDLFPGKTPARMVELNVAAAVLLDPALRAEYDRGREQPQPRAKTPWSPPRSASSGWASPPIDPVRAVAEDREVAHLVQRLRGSAARGLFNVGSRSAALTPAEHLILTFASVCLACLLIAAAHPRSLPGFQQEAPERNAMHGTW